MPALLWFLKSGHHCFRGVCDLAKFLQRIYGCGTSTITKPPPSTEDLRKEIDTFLARAIGALKDCEGNAVGTMKVIRCEEEVEGTALKARQP